jgi:hypothetical protein
MRTHFVSRLTVLAALAAGLTSAASGSEITEAQAISVAKAATTQQCSQATPGTYQARRKSKRWYVSVLFTKRNSPDEPPFTYPGGHEVIVVDDHGKLIETMPGE